MNFKMLHSLFIYILLLMLSACSDTENETRLVGLFTSAGLDIIAIDFPAAANENVISINTFFDYTIEGLQSNGIDTIAVTDNIIWSLSDGATSTIDRNGRLSGGSVAETLTITAQVGHLSQTFDVRISAAKFDQVIQLNSTQVLVNMCQTQQIIPIGSYLNDDGSEEQRPVDNSVINTIEWVIRNQEDNTPSQRAFIKTDNNITNLQALEAGNVIIQARAPSISSGNIITSADFTQTLDHNLNSLKLCLRSESDLAACTLSNNDVVENNVVSLMAVANYQAADGSNFNQNISAYSKWGIDNISNATIAFSADRQQLDITGSVADTTANISVACGNIEQTVQDSEIENGVVLTIPVSCASGNINCLFATEAMTIINENATSLSVTANGFALVDNTAFLLTTRPTIITLNVTANFANSNSVDITADVNLNYTNQNIVVLSENTTVPGEYTVLVSGDAQIQLVYQGQVFVAKITIQN